MPYVYSKYKDTIGPFMDALAKDLAGGGQGAMREAGQLMVARIQESMDAQVGLADGKKYAKWTPAYAKKRGAGKVLFLLGDLMQSWRIRIRKKKHTVTVYPGNLGENVTKARAHDGGIAQRTGKEKWNRLRLGWREKMLKEVGSLFLDAVIEEADKKSKKPKVTG